MNMMDIFDRFEKNSIRKELGITMNEIQGCINRWQEPHRYYHTINHLINLLNQIDDYIEDNFSSPLIEQLELVALYHDAILIPMSTSNEIDSAKLFESCTASDNIYDNENFKIIKAAIMDTIYNGTIEVDSDLFNIFKSFDYDKLYDMSVDELFQNSLLLMKEYQYIDYEIFIKKRIEFIDDVISKALDTQNTSNLEEYCMILSSYRPKIGLYDGSFNPFHIGHLNILEQAEKIFDKVIILVAYNSNKMKDSFRKDIVETLPFHQCLITDGMTTDVMKSIREYADVTLVRGLRNGYDLQYEENLKRLIEDSGECDFVYFLSDIKYRHISSSDVRGLSLIDNSNYEKYIPIKYNYYNMSKEK